MCLSVQLRSDLKAHLVKHLSVPLVLDLNKNETKDIVISDCGIIIEKGK